MNNMNDISILIPIHVLNEKVIEYTNKAINSVKENQKNYKNNLFIYIISPTSIFNEVKNNFMTSYERIFFVENTGETNFSSQINCGVENISTEYFSILEFDDEYTSKWFKMASEYYYGNEDVTLFLPLNIQYTQDNSWQYGNEMVLASSFSNELGFIDKDCLENCFTFNITGGIFNTSDFKNIGMLKPSIEVSFNYEYLLRTTHNNLRVMVVPKEGYKHLVGREGSLTEKYKTTFSDKELEKWFNLAKREYAYKEDRNKSINMENEEKIK